MERTIFEQALELHKIGFNLIPLKEASKEPVEGISWKRWRYFRQSRADIEAVFKYHKGNIGILCGEASENLLVLDCDTEEAFEYYTKELAIYSPGLVKTSRGGHVYLKTKASVKSTIVETAYGKVEFRSNGLYVAAPDSIHPSGLMYELLQPFSEIKPIAIDKVPGVRLCPDLDTTEVYTVIENSGLLKKLKFGHYKTRSESDMALITFLIRRGYGKEQIGYFMLRLDYGSHYVDLLNKNPARATAWLDLSIKKATGLDHSLEFINSKDKASRLKNKLLNTKLEGKNGSTLYKALLAHLDTYETSGKEEYHLSLREASEICGLSVLTFSKRNKELMKLGVVRLVKGSRGVEGNVYKLDESAFDSKFLHFEHTQSLETVTECVSYGEKGVFERGSYGHSSNQVYNLLKSRGKLTVKEITTMTGRSDNTVRRCLEKMERDGLVIKSSKWFEVTLKSVDDLSIEKNFIAISQKRKRKHKVERLNFLHYRQELQRKQGQ